MQRKTYTLSDKAVMVKEKRLNMKKNLLDKTIDVLDYFVGFCGHNKNLTKKQYFLLSDLKDEIEEYRKENK